jgi:RNA recognition motif-containing protein
LQAIFEQWLYKGWVTKTSLKASLLRVNHLKLNAMNIYVGNLDFKVDESDLEDIFVEYGTVASTKIIMDRFSGRSKGFGFVTMENGEEALKAIEALNGATFENREMVVNEAKPKKENY